VLYHVVKYAPPMLDGDSDVTNKGLVKCNYFDHQDPDIFIKDLLGKRQVNFADPPNRHLNKQPKLVLGRTQVTL
jgi:hypothetical protein